jgi:hypothetical protein
MFDLDHPSTSNVIKHLKTNTFKIKGTINRARSQNCDQMEKDASMVLMKRKFPLENFSSE